VAEQILSELSLRERQFSAFFFRTSDCHELNLMLDFGDDLGAVEVKLTY